MMLLTLELVADISESFEKQFAKGKPIVVKYYADWCMDCAILDEPYDEMSGYFTKKEVLITELDCTKTNQTYKFCQEKGIKTFPTVKVYNGLYGEETYDKQLSSFYDLKKFVLHNVRKDEL